MVQAAGRSALSRRQAMALLLGGAGGSLRALSPPDGPPVRLAVSESLITDVNLNDARATMLVFLKRMMADLNVTITVSPGVFDSTEEILRRARSGQLDVVALNVVEYRQIADMLDSTQIIAEAAPLGLETYTLLVKKTSGVRDLGDLRGRRLTMLRAPKMCVAPAWLFNLLAAGHFAPTEQFFSSVTSETKVSRVVLPVFFGQADACVTSKRGFDTMCELNPQVARELVPLASSPAMVVTFYIFHKNYRGLSRDRFAKVYADLPSSAAGRQLATFFQFENLVVHDAACLEPSLAILRTAEHNRLHAGPAGRRGA